MRVTKGHTGNRRSHHHLKEPRLSKCANCGAYHLRHRVCPECGHYRGKMIVDVVAKQEKKMQKLAQVSEANSEKESVEKAPEEKSVEEKVAEEKKEEKAEK